MWPWTEGNPSKIPKTIPQENLNFNPLLRNVVKWSDTLLKCCSICCKIFKVCLTILRYCEVKG